MIESLVQLNVRRRPAGPGGALPDVCPGKHPPAPLAEGCDAAAPPYWRSLQEWASTAEFEHVLHREFPAAASEWKDADGVSRRNFLKLMAASMALAGVSAGCDIRGP